jgi:hypothetical protein
VRSKRAAGAAIVTLMALALSSGTAVADGKGKRKGDTLRLVAVESQSAFIDLGDPGPSLGDEIVFSEVLKKRGREAGTSGGVCVATEVTPPYTSITYQCVATLSLDRGQITLQGLGEIQGEGDMGPFRLAITGGTGAYRGASGEATFRRVSDRRGIYKLRLDSDKKKKRKRHH